MWDYLCETVFLRQGLRDYLCESCCLGLYVRMPVRDLLCEAVYVRLTGGERSERAERTPSPSFVWMTSTIN